MFCTYPLVSSIYNTTCQRTLCSLCIYFCTWILNGCQVAGRTKKIDIRLSERSLTLPFLIDISTLSINVLVSVWQLHRQDIWASLDFKRKVVYLSLPTFQEEDFIFGDDYLASFYDYLYSLIIFVCSLISFWPLSDPLSYDVHYHWWVLKLPTSTFLFIALISSSKKILTNDVDKVNMVKIPISQFLRNVYIIIKPPQYDVSTEEHRRPSHPVQLH